jgi:two-component system sensor histidine kinase CreC
MSFLLRPFAGYLLLIALAAWFGNGIVERELKPAMRQAVEELLVDAANLLAEVASTPAGEGADGAGVLTAAYGRFAQRRFDADIHGVAKDAPALRLYLTDANGIVRFDSDGARAGTDFGRWNDVLRTLRGQYGARTTPSGAGGIDVGGADAASTMFVAAPLRGASGLAGVLSLGKDSGSLEPFFARARASILRAGGAWVVAAVGIAFGLSWWLSRDLRRLSQYARDAAAGRRVPAPRFRGGELATLSSALAGMRAELEGKAHVEHYAQLLTHELKGPLAAIGGAAELLDEEMPAADRRRFVGNIRGQVAHMQALVERLLQLAVLERQATLADARALALREVVDAAVAACAPALRAKSLAVDVQVDGRMRVWGDALLLRQAIANLLDNAIAFSGQGGSIDIAASHEGAHDVVRVRDRGAGLPAFARERVFERFYSLPRPDTGSRSTGLGLLLVREVAALHGGHIRIDNRDGGGVEAVLRIAHRGG